MANKFPSSSFIPKGGAQYVKPAPVRSKRKTGLLLKGSFILAAIAALAAGAVFFYIQYLQSDLAEKKQQLTQAQAAFDPEIIDELKQVDSRINSAQTILEDHTAATPVFAVVEDITLASVQLVSLSIDSPEVVAAEENEEDAGPPRVEVSLVGVARDYASVALQSQALKENEVVQNPVLSNFTLNDQADVEFSITFSLAPEYMDYETTI